MVIVKKITFILLVEYEGYKVNIMHPYAISSLHFEQFEVEYTKGLFEQDNQYIIDAIDALFER